MKQIIKYLFCLSLLFTLSFSLVGCTNGDNDKDNNMNNTANDNNANNDDNNDDIDDDFDDIDDKVKNQFNDDYVVNRDDVIDATNYIRNNLDNVKDKEVAKKLYEKGSYLEMAANRADVGEDDLIRSLGIQAKNYASRVYRAKDDEVDDIINDAKGDFDSFKSKFENGVDNAVDNFMSFFDNKKND